VQETGFLGTEASRAADITLLLEMGMGAGLLAGAVLARAGRIRIHAACQSAVVLFNLALIVLTMFPAFHRQVLPKLPDRIGKPYYALAATHAARYKFWMRRLLLVWWIVLFLGMATYARWYVTLR